MTFYANIFHSFSLTFIKKGVTTMTNNEYREKIRDMLVQARIDANRSQAYVADAIGVCERTVQNWEACISAPEPYQIVKWFDTLHVDIVEYYLIVFGCCNPLDDILKSIVQRLSAEHKDALYNIHKTYGLEKIIDLLCKEIEVLKNENSKT